MQSEMPKIIKLHEKLLAIHEESPIFKGKTATPMREITTRKIALDERLDARIDKAIKRLAQLKAFKQILEEQASRAGRIDQRSIANNQQQTGTH